VPGAEALEGQSLWSDAETWEHMRGEWGIAEGAPNRLPAEGDDVYIPPTKWVVLDVDTPVLAKLNVSGRLTLDDTKAITLNVHNLGVIAPTASPDAKGIYIGSPDEPRVHPATIRFHGWRESDALILDNSQFLDNKVMGVFANVSVHGVQTLAGEAVELRAAVGMLTRSIKFEAVLDPDHDEVDEVNNPSNRYPDMYGFHVHVGEFGKDVDFGDGEQRLDYVGKLHLSNVQFIGGGQMGMQHSAIWVDYRKRDGSVDDDSPATADARPVNTISNCAFVSSWNRILRVEGDVPGLEFEDNVVSQAYDSAVFFAKAGSHGARINRNLIASVRYNIDLMAGNLVAGSADQGMTFRPELCVPGQDQSPAGAVIVDNEVVSSLIGMFMIGAHLSERVHCQRLVRAKVWRASHIGVFTTDQTSHMLLHDVTVADSHIGVSLNYFRSASKSYSWIVDSTIIGTSEAGSCSACHTMTADDPRGEGACASTVSGNHRVGILVPQYTNRAKTCFSDVTSLLPPEACWPPTLPERLCNMPWEQRHGLMVTRHQELHITGTKLLNFKAEECGSGSFAIKFNPTQSEAAVPITISGADWTGTDEDAKVSLHMESNTDAKCRTRGCDSFDYMYIKDTDGSSFGASGGIVLRDPTYTVGHTCTSKPAWGQGLLCTGDITASHAFVSESLDRDRGFRRLEPIAMQRPEASGTVARYGAHGPLDDNCAKRFYFGQQHGLVMPSDGVTVMNVTGTLPGRWRMHWFSTDPAEAFVLGLFIRRPYRMNVYVGNTLVAPITTVDTLPTTADPAGTNVFIPQSLTLWLTFRGHEDFPPITVVRQTEVQLDMTLAMSVDEFYGSIVKRNLATLLNIPPDRIQEADVQAASTKVSFIIIPANGRVDPGPGSEPDGRTPTTGDRVDPTTCEYDEDTGSVVAGSCTAHEPDQYEANVAELYGHVDTIVGRMRAGTFSEAIGAEVLGMEINAPPRGTENTADEDE
ncbi:PKHD1L1, partial [Symbiodinium sp. KB8]